jgi:multiple sugar transport system permease protein
MLDRTKRLGRALDPRGHPGVLTFFFAFPFVWMLITAFKRTSDLYDLKHNPFLFYEPPTLEHVKRLFFETLYGQWLLNTAFVGILVVLITLLLAVPAGYALARLTRNWGRQAGHRHFSHLFGSTHLALHPALTSRGQSSPR